jgi:uncharacterized protein YndB with AHSA1/START domain
MSNEFECRREIILPGSPEEVWEAVATASGNAAWLFTNPIAPDGSGATAWDPPHRFAVRTERGEWFNALEFVIEGRHGGTTLLRYMHSGIFVDDWDTQYDAVQQHTDFYLHTLGEYLEHFNPRPATYIGDAPAGIQGPRSSARADGFRRLKRALGVGAHAEEGDRFFPIAEAPEPIEGTIDYLRPNFVGVRTSDALYRFFGRNAFGAPVGMSIHVFRDDIDAEQTKASWHQWLHTALAQ